MKSRTLLLAAFVIMAAGIGWIVLRGSSASLLGPGAPQAVVLDVEIKNVTVQKTGDHGHLILTATFKQAGSTPLRLEPPLVKLLTADGQAAPRYLGPMLPEPVLSGPGPLPVALHYWLPLIDLSSPLTLEVTGQRYPVTMPAN